MKTSQGLRLVSHNSNPLSVLTTLKSRGQELLSTSSKFPCENEPASLTMYRQQPGATYEGFRDKDALRKALVDEQRGLCCYCLSRIRPEIGGMKIEHWHPQALYGNEQLDYANLLGSCMGNDGQRRADYIAIQAKRIRSYLAIRHARPIALAISFITFRMAASSPMTLTSMTS